MESEKTQTEILGEILKWIKVTSFNEVKDVLNSILDTNSKKLIYQLSDGKITSTEIITKAKVSSATITKYWQEWEKAGIGDSKSVRGGIRFIRSFDLSSFGINVLSTSSKKEAKNYE